MSYRSADFRAPFELYLNMGTLKTYQIKNISSAVIAFRLGKAKFRCTFDKGVLNVPNPRPATFSTDNPIVQAAIEKSPLYGKKVTLLSSFERNRPVAAGKAVAMENASPEKDTRVYEDITEFGEAINVLRGLGVPARKLKTEESIIRAAEEMGVWFPNVARMNPKTEG